MFGAGGGVAGAMRPASGLLSQLLGLGRPHGPIIVKKTIALDRLLRGPQCSNVR